MADIFMAGLAHRKQITLSVPVLIGVEPVQRQIWPPFYVVHMVNHYSSAVFSASLAQLALMTIQAENIGAKPPPFRRNIERVDIACGD